jgi:diguanylate cyclase (GGDEF)-like protein/PAS domain S-box-containing protein
MYVRAQTCTRNAAHALSTMSRNILLILANASEAKAVRRSILDGIDNDFRIEWVSRLSAARTRLNRCGAGEDVAAIVLDLFLPDSLGIGTLEVLLHAAPRVPILVLCRLRDEEVAKLAVQRGAQDYLLEERLDGYSLTKALGNMLRRSAHASSHAPERELAQITLDSIGDAIISTDAAGKVTYLNPVAESMTGWPGHEARGLPLQQVLCIVDGDSRQPAPNPLSAAMLRNESVGLGANCILVRRDGHECAIEDNAAPIRDQHGQVTGAVIVFHDVGVARAMSLRMSYLAQHDFLTELPNRMLLSDRLMQAIAATHRHGKALAVLFLDVDNFKHVNDSLGHAAGDQLLKSIAGRLLACVRASDTVSRQGGDEFVLLLSEVTRVQDVALTADKILAAVRRPHHVEGRELYITVSVGIAIYPADGSSAEALLKSADLAMSRAKSNGRGHHQFFKAGGGAGLGEPNSSSTS